jgi:hypothetical protein
MPEKKQEGKKAPANLRIGRIADLEIDIVHSEHGVSIGGVINDWPVNINPPCDFFLG